MKLILKRNDAVLIALVLIFALSSIIYPWFKDFVDDRVFEGNLSNLNGRSFEYSSVEVLIPKIVVGKRGKININQAGSEELQRLTGIGVVLAEKIINYRERKGKFREAGDLLKIRGIGYEMLDEFSDMIIFEKG